MNIVQIVPRLPPATDGIGDYALNLAQQLRRDFGIKTHFVVSDCSWSGEKMIDNFQISQLPSLASNTLLSLLSEKKAKSVLLHYVGYGYAKRGCPVWLVDGLKVWRTQRDHRKLVTMFHEISASGAIWTSTFWLSQLQKKIAANLVQLSDRILTSKQLYADILTDMGKGKHSNIPAMPVFSNIGEPQQVQPLSKRQPWLVIFGGKNVRQRAYLKSRVQIGSICQILGIEKIIDIGIPTGLSLSNINGIPIQEKGRLLFEEISDTFLNCSVGFLHYDPEFLAKSTIFNAYCSHGLLAINATGHTGEIDGIKSGKTYLIADESIKKNNNFQEIANNSYSWYQKHSLSVQTQLFAHQLVDRTSPYFLST